jgi:glycogen operon protein
MKERFSPGQCYPLGANFRPGGVNFCIYSESALAVELCLFDDADQAKPSRVLRLDPRRNKTFAYWHVLVPALQAGQLYGFKVYGPYDPENGLRFDGSKLLLDPYARAVMKGQKYSREAALRPGDNSQQAMKSIVVDPRAYDWEDDMPLGRPMGALIYEMHVGGFTKHPSSGVTPAKRGTYAGLIEKIPYLQELGITAVELLPVQQFDEESDHPPLKNYWGYAPMAFFTPHQGYCSCGGPFGALNEFRDMVKAFHLAGIEVILDVVFNHTAEGGDRGPTFGFRGFEDRVYYILDDRGHYANYSGVGNTVNGNQSVVRRLILDCLRYWVQTMHVDGFRFDLASVLARDESGVPLKNPPILLDIESDPILAGTKIIAEAWDAAGLYQLGTFVGHRWAEWNGQFRDDVRRFVKGDDGTVERLSFRLEGSPDLFPLPSASAIANGAIGGPVRSINFLTCHDGFTLDDLVSYNYKHNEANLEGNRDGTDANYSWNCGSEGPTPDPRIEDLRLRQIKNFFTILFISQGTPMLLMGDETRRTQNGNNNAYCQDNETTWFHWDGLREHADLLRFVRGLIRLNRDHSLYEAILMTRAGAVTRKLTWHGVRLGRPDWGHDSHSLAFSLTNDNGSENLHLILNAYWEALDFELPALMAGKHWCRAVDTSLPSPDDYCEPGHELPLTRNGYVAQPRSSVILIAR